MGKKGNELSMKFTEEYESAMADIMVERITLLEKERDVKLKANLEWINPEFAYQNTPEYLDTIRDNVILNTKVEIIKLRKQLRDVELNAVDREETAVELEKLKNE